MIYIVSGFMRSGTSMMMRAMEAGGMQAVYSKARDTEMNARWGEADGSYVPNDSYYELAAEDYRGPEFPGQYEGKLIKCLIGGALRLPVGECRVVVMRRPAREIALSLRAFFGSVPAQVEREGFDEQMARSIEILRDRRSFLTVDEVWYGDVIANPAAVLGKLNWPIDIDKAARIPSRKQARFSDARAA